MTPAVQAIRFYHQGRIVELDSVPATRTVLDWLREDAHCSGTKEGCNEGDCGACTVALGDLPQGGGGPLHIETVNACMRFVPTLHGKALFTVEDLKAMNGGALHPVQEAMVACHGSQCGFCTPGFVMSLWAAYERHLNAGTRPDRASLADELAGNLCRCTGYRPILDAGERMFDRPAARLDGGMVAKALKGIAAGDLAQGQFHAPQTVEALAALLASRPKSRLLAGGTDIGVWINKQMRDLGDVVYLGRIESLKRIDEVDGELRIGAGASLEAAWSALVERWPALREMWVRFASPPIRHAGTMGGNVANGSPIGDSAPVLMALDASLELRLGERIRRLRLDEFYTGYMANRLEPGEFVQAIVVPLSSMSRRVAAYKISKRFDSDISAVCAVFALEMDGAVVRDARCVLGGMAAVVKRAAATEAALVGQAWSAGAVAAAQAALAQDFQPLSDMRASAAYRMEVSRNLLQRFWLETQGDAPPARPSSGDTPPQRAAMQSPREGGVGSALPHESAHLHVAGEARYTDDIPELTGTLHAALGLSPVARGTLQAVDVARLRSLPGVVDVIVAADIPGVNDCGAIVHDDPILAEGELRYLGQPVFAVIARSRLEARRAAALAKEVLSIAALPAVLTPREAHAQGLHAVPPMHLQRSEAGRDVAASIAAAPHRLKGSLSVGGQEQFYLEGQISVAVPQEDGGMLVHCSTQHPSEMQHHVATALGLTSNAVRVECRRMGGGFGGKESQSAQFACIAAVAARRLNQPVKLRVDRDDDFLITGRRHCFEFDYEAGFDDEGRVLGYELTLISRAGHSADLSGPVMTRAICHVDNAYWLPEVAMHGYSARTNTQSNTAFRGFGGPQGAIVTEVLLDSIARTLGRDPLDVRRANFYGTTSRNVTPYGQVVDDNVIGPIVDELERTSGYRERRSAIEAFNASSAVRKRGISLTPVKFGISFNVKHLNQAGALVHVYTDGSILVNHGGTEMGQGLHTKVAQVVAHELGVPLTRVRVSATDTHKVVNTSATAASSGSDLNGKAAQDAARQIRERLTPVAAQVLGVDAADVRFESDAVHAAGRSLPFKELVAKAYEARVQLWSDGFYATPGLHWDRETLTGHPFYYFAYGAAVSEVEVDTLTGEHRLLRADLLHDVGRSLNPAVDIGQVEGAFIQGMGWLTFEELVWHPQSGLLWTHAPSTYKIPTANDCPPVFNVRLFDNANVHDSIHRSKAVGEPPLLLAFSVFLAIRDAVSATGGHRVDPPLRAPATPEAVLAAVRAVAASSGSA
jgi:xanthine dehydrogenase large subunit